MRFRSTSSIAVLMLFFCYTLSVADDVKKEPPSASDTKTAEKTDKPSGDQPGEGAGDKPKADADDKKDDDVTKEQADNQPKVVTISGVFEAIESAEILADTEHFIALEIKRIVPHGSPTTKGKNVVWFETDDVTKQLKNAEVDLRLAELALNNEEFAFTQFVETQKLDREAAERRHRQAQQNFDNYAQVDRDREILTAEFSLKSSRASLENAKEELEQLQQMYKEDDLTEESEEIVLKRAKRAVEAAEFRVQGTEIRSDRVVKQDIPRSEALQQETLARAQLTYQKSLRGLTSARATKVIELARKRDKFKEQKTKVAELRAERKMVVLKSPIDGIVLHGELNRGRLSEKTSKLKLGSKVKPSQVVATVVNSNRLRIRVSLEVKNLADVAVGGKCRVTTKALPDFEANGVVKSIAKIAYAGTKYDCVVAFKTKKNQLLAIMPTMTCDLEFPAKEASDEKNE